MSENLDDIDGKPKQIVRTDLIYPIITLLKFAGYQDLAAEVMKRELSEDEVDKFLEKEGLERYIDADRLGVNDA